MAIDAQYYLNRSQVDVKNIGIHFYAPYEIVKFVSF